MRLLVDNSVSWRVARDLREAGHDTVHVADLHLAEAVDQEIYRVACADSRVLLTQDSDFGPIHASAPSRVGVILLRLSDGTPRLQATILAANLPDLDPALSNGAFVTIEDDGIRVQQTHA